MLLSVPIGKSFAGCFTVTIPGLARWLNWWCEPFTRTTVHPSDFNRRSTSFESILSACQW